MEQKLNIVCAIRAIPPMQEFGENPAVTATVEHIIENQRGTWNKDVINFFVKGEPDELFAERTNFMKRAFNVAFTEWDIEIPIVFHQVYTEEESDIVIEWGTKEGDKYYPGDKGKYVLAYAGYPEGALKGYMKIFTDWDWSVFGNLNIVTVIIHELGHLLGRPHSERKLWLDIMDPVINSRNTELSDHDILGATTEYGVREYNTETGHDRLEQANQHQKNRLKLEEIQSIKTKQ